MLFLKALHCKNKTKRPPIWIMRQAGRYLPEYQKLREKYSLEELFYHQELIAKITLQPIARFHFDAAILFADILHVLLPLGIKVSYPKGGPQIEPFDRLERGPVEERLFFVKEGIHLLKKELKVPLIGFCGGPFTVAYYLLKKKPEKMLYERPQAFLSLIQTLTQVSKEYLKLQINAGVDAIQIFDSWAGLLPYEALEKFVLPFLKELVSFSSVPVIVFSRMSSFLIDEFVSLHPSGIGFDGGKPLAKIRKKVPQTISVQGNLSPSFLYSSCDVICQMTKELLDSMKGDPGFIVNLGHGILPDIPLTHVHAFVDTVLQCEFNA